MSVLGQLEGRLKSFSALKGYGFVESATLTAMGYQDAFILPTELGTAQVGDDVQFTCFLNEKGKPQVSQLGVVAAGGFANAMQAHLATLSPQDAAEAFAMMGHSAPATMATAGMGHAGTQSAHGLEGPAIGVFQGVVAKINEEKGYGFIHAEGLESVSMTGDVWVHRTQLRDCKRGDAVQFEAFINQKGMPQAREVIKLQSQAAPTSIGHGVGSTAQAAEGAEEIGPFQGVIKSFSSAKGYGFIECQDVKDMGYTNDTFLFQRQLNGCAIGDSVSFLAFINEKGTPQCKEMMLLERAVNPNPPVNPQGGPCKLFVLGQCHFGGTCKYSHDLSAAQTLNEARAMGQESSAIGQFQARPHTAGGYGFGMTAQAIEGESAEELGPFQGVIKSFFPMKGYGFIECQDVKDLGYTNDTFLFQRHLNGCAIGDTVSFLCFINDKGQPQCKELTCLDRAVNPQPPRNPQGGPCKLFLLGQCHFGGTCKFSHDPLIAELTAAEEEIHPHQQLGSHTGVMKSFSSHTGYGFIFCPKLKEDGYTNDVFLHYRALNGQNVSVGDEVVFDAYLNNKNQPQASEVTSSTGATSIVVPATNVGAKRAFGAAGANTIPKCFMAAKRAKVAVPVALADEGFEAQEI